MFLLSHSSKTCCPRIPGKYSYTQATIATTLAGFTISNVYLHKHVFSTSGNYWWYNNNQTKAKLIIHTHADIQNRKQFTLLSKHMQSSQHCAINGLDASRQSPCWHCQLVTTTASFMPTNNSPSPLPELSLVYSTELCSCACYPSLANSSDHHLAITCILHTLWQLFGLVLSTDPVSLLVRVAQSQQTRTAVPSSQRSILSHWLSALRTIAPCLSTIASCLCTVLLLSLSPYRQYLTKHHALTESGQATYHKHFIISTSVHTNR